jgi:hypothetical protein
MFMVETMVATHAMLVKLFVGFMAAALFVPFMAKEDGLKFKKLEFVYTMTFQAIITMIAFSGVVAWMVGDMPFTLSVGIMIAVWVVLMAIEIKKHRLVKFSDASKPEVLGLLKSLFVKITVVEMLIVLAMVGLKIMEAKGVVSLS